MFREGENIVLTLTNEDALDGMALLEPESVDLIISDYPFNCQDGRTDYVSFVDQTAIEYERILRDGGNLLVLNNPANIFKTTNSFRSFTFRNGVALIRRGSLRPAWMLGFQHNYALLLCKGSKKDKWNGPTTNHDKNWETDVRNYQNGYRGMRGRWHPQALPLPLVNDMVELLSNEGDIVLDPFMGAGTVALACLQLNRDYIGFEINRQYWRIAKTRTEGFPLPLVLV